MASMTDAIIHSHERATVAGHGQVNLLHFHHQSVLMITAQAVGLYRDRAALDDPLGNGALGFELIPAALRPVWEQHCGYVREQMAGLSASHPVRCCLSGPMASRCIRTPAGPCIIRRASG